jgi:sugar lactone lactonase YvrE
MRRIEAQPYFQPIGEHNRFLPEGPRAMRRQSREGIAWVNIQCSPDSTHGSLFFYDPKESREEEEQVAFDHRLDCASRPGFLLPIDGGDRVLVGLEKVLQVCDLAKGDWSPPLASIPDRNPRTIINDAEIVPGGKAIVFGTKDTKFDMEAKLAELYLYTVDDNRISVLADKQVCSNGKVTEERGPILYDIDTPTRKVVRYRLDLRARTATPDGVALDLANQVGFPDGMRGCGDGTAIIAFYNPELAEAGRAVRFNLATGEAVQEWTTPGSPRVTCPLLVKRPDGVKLILTTATEGMPADMRAKCCNAGCLFIADTQLAECPAPEVVGLS